MSFNLNLVYDLDLTEYYPEISVWLLINFIDNGIIGETMEYKINTNYKNVVTVFV